jgi:hypothetical protein
MSCVNEATEIERRKREREETKEKSSRERTAAERALAEFQTIPLGQHELTTLTR